MANEDRRRRWRDRLGITDRPSPPGPPPERDSPRQYLLFGLIFVGLVAGGVLLGVYGGGDADPAEAPGTPVGSEVGTPVDPSAPGG